MVEEKSQAIEGYACACGFKTPDLRDFQGHQLTARGDEHRSLGRVNLDTGEIVMPPAKDRTPEQWAEARYGKKREKRGNGNKPTSTVKTTDVLSQAVEIRFVPRVYTIDLSPTIRIGMEASRRLWGWNLNLSDFLDTVTYRYFSRCGVRLGGFEIDETEEERQQREAFLQEHKEEEQEVKNASST